MALFCTFIFGSLCLSAPLGDTTIRYSNAGMGDTMELRLRDWRLTTARTDVVETLDKVKLASVCRDEACVYYWRHCDVTDCTFYFGMPDENGRIAEQHLSLKADSPVSLADAMAHVGVKTGGDKLVSLSEMDQDSAAAQPPLCRGIPSPGCS